MSMIAALLEERRGYVLRGLRDRVAQVDAEIERLGGVKVVDGPVDVPVEEAVDPVEVEMAVKRGPGRPRKLS